MAVGEARGRRSGWGGQRPTADEARRGWPATGSGRAPPDVLRVLISFTPGYVAYGEAFFLGLLGSRPKAQMRLVPFREAGEAVARFQPHLVISDGVVAAPGAAKARIASEPTEPSTMRLGGVVRTVVNPSLEDLLAFVEEVAEFVGKGR